MHYILLWFLVSSATGGSATFEDKAACEYAATVVRDYWQRNRVLGTATCVPARSDS